MSKLSPARRFACRVLLEAAQGSGYVRELAERAAYRPRDARDAAFGLRLALGVTATSGCLDELLDRFIAKPKKVDAGVRTSLRIAVFELAYLNTAPEVAVSQGVELVRERARSAAGLANAVLRRVADAREAYLAAADAPIGERRLVAAARGAGLPAWLARAIRMSLGAEQAQLLFDAQLEPAPVCVHLRPGVAGAPQAACDEDGPLCAASTGSLLLGRGLPGCLLPASPASFISSGALAAGDAVASDAAAQLIATLATAPGSCLEIGAGRGTKTYLMAAQARRAGWSRTHIAAELSPGKTLANRERLEHAGLAGGVSFATGDCRDLESVLGAGDAAAGGRRQFDSVFVDAPCSGTGTMRRHPEIPWRLAEEDAERNLPELQLALLEAAAQRVAPGGQLLYATCSVLAAENAGVVEAFLAGAAGEGFSLAPLSEAPITRAPGFERFAEQVRLLTCFDGTLQTVPALGGCDGHFCARFVRNIHF